MVTIEILFLAVGLAMDAFAVSVSVGTTSFLVSKRARFRISFHFGLFQFLMPVMGWFAGSTVEPYIRSIDHWIAFVLLSYVGGRMIRESRDQEEKQYGLDPSRGWNLVLLSLATSIDALAVGLSLGIIRADIWYPALLTGGITCALSLTGILLGNKISALFGKKVELIGGLILIVIGIRILVEHLFF